MDFDISSPSKVITFMNMTKKSMGNYKYIGQHKNNYYTPPHKKWQGIITKSGGVLRYTLRKFWNFEYLSRPSVRTHPQVHKRLDFRWFAMYFKWDFFRSHLKSVIYVAKMALCG